MRGYSLASAVFVLVSVGRAASASCPPPTPETLPFWPTANAEIPVDSEMVFKLQGSPVVRARIAGAGRTRIALTEVARPAAEVGTMPAPTRGDVTYLRLAPVTPLTQSSTYTLVLLNAAGTTTTSSVAFSTSAQPALPMASPQSPTLYFAQHPAPIAADVCGTLANQITHAVVTLPAAMTEPYFIRYTPIFGAPTTGFQEPPSEIFVTPGRSGQMQFTAFSVDRGPACAEIELRNIGGLASAPVRVCNIAKCDVVRSVRQVRSIMEWARAAGVACTIPPPDAGTAPLDAAAGPADAGIDPLDAGGSTAEAGIAAPDADSPLDDARASPEPDAAMSSADAASTADAGHSDGLCCPGPSGDGGPSEGDGGSSAPDGGPGDGAGAEKAGGCGATQGPAGLELFLGLLALAWLRSRRSVAPCARDR